MFGPPHDLFGAGRELAQANIMQSPVRQLPGLVWSRLPDTPAIGKTLVVFGPGIEAMFFQALLGCVRHRGRGAGVVHGQTHSVRLRHVLHQMSLR